MNFKLSRPTWIHSPNMNIIFLIQYELTFFFPVCIISLIHYEFQVVSSNMNSLTQYEYYIPHPIRTHIYIYIYTNMFSVCIISLVQYEFTFFVYAISLFRFECTYNLYVYERLSSNMNARWMRRQSNSNKHFRIYYGMATCTRLLKITGLFCKRTLWKRRYSAKETYNFKEPTDRSHPIVGGTAYCIWSVISSQSPSPIF